jgi:hypothetical protein
MKKLMKYFTYTFEIIEIIFHIFGEPLIIFIYFAPHLVYQIIDVPAPQPNRTKIAQSRT